MQSVKQMRWILDDHLRLVTRKPVSGVCDQGTLKLACAATEATCRQRLEILGIEIRGITLSR